ncbi:MAG: adenylate/guanylate cyclase domain-containing protein [Desulfobacterales bacterium]|nr:adenylate/guanylate cyclase domain-containing protein [Desulfobacterales bacterium]
MKELARPILKYICNLTVKNRSPAFLMLDQDNCIQDWGGKLDTYGIEALEKGEQVEDRMFILNGFFPLDEEHMELQGIETESGVPADIHIFSQDKAVWVLFLDASEEQALQSVLQQKINDLCLLRDKHAKILEQYIGKEISERLLDLKLKKNGESKYISVLFADICGFTPLNRQKSPREIFKLLNEYLAYMVKPVLDEGGTLGNIMGDEIMGIFGITPGDSSIQAVKAGFRIIENIKSLNTIREIEGHDTFRIRIGIGSGHAALGLIGTWDRRSTLSAVGPCVNLGACLKKQAGPDKILIDENTFRKIDDMQDRFSETSLKSEGICEPFRTSKG